jgi:hypothetical protein
MITGEVKIRLYGKASDLDQMAVKLAETYQVNVTARDKNWHGTRKDRLYLALTALKGEDSKQPLP